MPGFDKHIVRVAKVMPAGGNDVSALRGALRGAVHGRGMPVDAVHSGAGASGADLGGLTVLMVAARRGRADAIDVLLKEFSAGAGSVDDTTSARAALTLAVSGDHVAAARSLRAWLGQKVGGDASEEGEVADDSEEGEVAGSGSAQQSPRTEAAPSKPSVFARLKMTADAGSSSTFSANRSRSVAGAGDSVPATSVSPKWKKDYSELSFADKLRMLKAPAAPADDASSPHLAKAPQDGWVRFGAVHSQWRDHLEIRSDGTFSRVSRDDGGRWGEVRWQGEIGEITIQWANWDVSDTLHSTDGGASFHAVGTNQWGDEYQFTLKATEVSGGGHADEARRTLSLPAWFNPAEPEVQAASGDFGRKARRRDRPSREGAHGDTEQGRKRHRQGDSATMAVPKASRLKVLERGAKFGTLSTEQQAELAELRAGGAGGSDDSSDEAGPIKRKRSSVASSSSLDNDMDDYFKK